MRSRARDVGEPQVEHDHVGAAVGEFRQRIGAVCRLDDMVAVRREARAQEAPDRRLVVYDEHFDRRRVHAAFSVRAST
jgi:hypothetical protein